MKKFTKKGMFRAKSNKSITMEKTEKPRKLKKIIKNLILFILLIVLTFSLILKDQDLPQMANIIRNVKKPYLLIGALAMCIYVICEATNIGRILKELGEKSTLLKNIKYTLIGFFFSSITPAASGGQPLEIYYMHRENIKVANSTLALLMQLCCMQIVTITMGIVSAVIHFDVIKDGLVFFVILGIGLNSSALILLLIAIFSKKLSKGLINIAVKILKFLKIPKLEEKQEKLEKELQSYQESAVYIKKHKMLMLKTLLTTAVQILVYYSVPYWVYRAFGFNTLTIWQLITLQALLYATVSGIPSPGAVGVSEGGFLGIFKNVFPTTIISSAMLLNRGINFYLLVLVSGIISTINALKDKKEDNQKVAVEVAGNNIYENQEINHINEKNEACDNKLDDTTKK